MAGIRSLEQTAYSNNPKASGVLQSNSLKWIAVGPAYQYPLRQSIHLSMFYTFALLLNTGTKQMISI